MRNFYTYIASFFLFLGLSTNFVSLNTDTISVVRFEVSLFSSTLKNTSFDLHTVDSKYNNDTATSVIDTSFDVYCYLSKICKQQLHHKLKGQHFHFLSYVNSLRQTIFLTKIFSSKYTRTA
ncbi:hypothetical protein MARI151_20276 [Maribacter litoralis]|uniref:Uncharacterized protein n=1 Tax=Maribacter litoralis TaxID=2059726 RepID=A0A653PLU3_9FLAO|nr:hypothetical protein MARI151_20276 [Maribacter litoralis]